MSKKVHNTLLKSLLRFCNDTKEALIADGVVTDMDVVNFDAHATMASLPNKDVIGIKSFSWTEEETLAVVTVLFGVSTINDDVNLSRHNDIIDYWTSKLMVSDQIQLFDPNTDPVVEIGWMVITDGTDVLPISNTSTRPLQLIAVNMKSDLSVK